MAKNGASPDDAALTRLQILALDRALSDVVLRSECLSLRAKDQLAAMKRKLRAMRIELEISYRLPEIGALRVLPAGYPCAGNSHPEHVTPLNIRASLNKAGGLTSCAVPEDPARVLPGTLPHAGNSHPVSGQRGIKIPPSD
ncbi:hypothetical protein SAMN05877831_10390 [Rhodobacter maris]|uniref:Uncharacterized protein n=2 Tax=Rhodobacter maris TaxID=446682 RepID=A0A285S4V3_9RHOB|nr:hypothetical protein SAMN05877831_10390 [Rhodobacter maris]